MKNLKKIKAKGLWNKTSLIKWMTFLGALTIMGITIWLIDDSKLQNGEKNIKYYKAKVIEVNADTTVVDEKTEGVRKGSQVIKIKLMNGPYQGDVVTMDNYLSALYNIYAKNGSRIIVRATIYPEGPSYSVYNYDRTPVLTGFVVLFMVSICIIGGKKGLMALLSLLLTLIAVVKILIPLLIQGFPAITTTIVLIVIVTIVSYILLDGINVKTISATSGTIIGVMLSGLLAYIVGLIGHVSGFQMEEAESLLLIAGEHGLKIRNLFVCGIFIASLGAIMDIAMSIASAIHELHEVNPSLNINQLFRSAMNIGKDAMGTMTNTLILAFTGSSLNLLLIIYSYGIPFSQLINTDIIAIEIIKGIAGSIGIVLTVPIIAYFGSIIEKRYVHKI
ncbi:MAG: YibE/F-like protein [Anaerocolumna sp.]|jgi:uncharacterized membrane protein|nr:YibE/F-like protein [Anaerocolumna sp.]